MNLCIIEVAKYKTMKQPIIANIGTLIYKNERDYVYNSILLVEGVLDDTPEIEDILITFKDFKNVFIYELLPATPSWKNINWQNYILKYVELIYPKNTGPALVDKYTSEVIWVIFDVKPEMFAIVP